MAWNTKNPAVRRIMQEIKELEQEHSTDFVAEALEVRARRAERLGARRGAAMRDHGPRACAWRRHT